MQNMCKIAVDGEACRKCKGRYCANKISIFQNLKEDQLGEITSKIKRKDYLKNEVVFFEGDRADRLYLLNKGKVKVYRYNKEGKEQIIYILSEGDFIGDSAIFKSGEFKFSAEAIEDTNICELTKEDFQDIIRENPEIALKVLENTYERMEKLEQLVQSLSTKDVETRIAGLLLNFIKDFGKPSGNEIIIELPLSREDLANYIGVTRETISRKLSLMQEEGILRLVGNKKIVIQDFDRLEEKHQL